MSCTKTWARPYLTQPAMKSPIIKSFPWRDSGGCFKIYVTNIREDCQCDNEDAGKCKSCKIRFNVDDVSLVISTWRNAPVQKKQVTWYVKTIAVSWIRMYILVDWLIDRLNIFMKSFLSVVYNPDYSIQGIIKYIFKISGKSTCTAKVKRSKYVVYVKMS